MQTVTPDFIHNKKVLLRMDIDVPLGNVAGDFRLEAGLPTLKMCLEHASEVIVMGHIGRPGGKEDPELSVGRVFEWLSQELGEPVKLRILENLRFEPGEESCDLEYAKELASFGDVYVNEAFASYHPASSTTILPTLLPHRAGLRFVKEVEKLKEVRENPKKPLVVIIGGAKVEDKLPVVEEMAKIADYVLVGGKIASEIQNSKFKIQNVLVGELNKEGTDVTPETIEKWQEIIAKAKMVVWNGPLGKIQNSEDMSSERGTYELAHILADSDAEVIVGGGDTVGFLQKLGMLEKFGFVSTGGGAMLKFLEKGTLATIEALK